MKQLEYKIDINSSAKEVWNKMFSPETYVEWIQVSWPGSFYEGEWKQGTDIRFIGQDGSGTLAHIEELVPFKLVSANHVAVLQKGGLEDRDSADAKGWVGTKEAYEFDSEGDLTHLTVHISANPDWIPMFDEGFPNALKKLKEICEK